MLTVPLGEYHAETFVIFFIEFFGIFIIFINVFVVAKSTLRFESNKNHIYIYFNHIAHKSKRYSL